jgi:hypothetical protein
MEITLKFNPISEGLPPLTVDEVYGAAYSVDSIECAVIVDGKMLNQSFRYCFDACGGWIFGDLSLNCVPFELNVTHWAPWPEVPQEVSTIPSPVWVDDDLLALY